MNVTDEADMECVPYERLSLSESIISWSKNMERLATTPKMAPDEIKIAIENKGFSLSNSVSDIVRIYLHG